MLRAYAHAYQVAANYFEFMRWSLLIGFESPEIRRDTLRYLGEQIIECRDACHDLGLIASTMRLNDLAFTFRFGGEGFDKTDIDHIRDELRQVNRTIEHELAGRKFLYVPPAQAERYEAEQPFGEIVADRFPLAARDIEEAAKCLALGRNTAAAFHLMRVCEFALKYVAGTLRIPTQRDWGAYIRAVNDAIRTKPKVRGVSWKRDESFYQDVAGDIQAIKLAWRNPGIHVERTYEREEAEQVYHAVRVFLVRLAERLPGPKVFR